jgi:glucose/arabinose dehydrogenase
MADLIHNSPSVEEIHRMERRLSRAALITALLGLSAFLPSGALAAAPALTVNVVHAGLVNPWDVAFAPGGEMFVTERPGRVRVYQNGGVNATLLETTTLSGVRAEGESGVMGIALDHLFSTNRYAYICVSRQFNGKWLNQLIRYTVRLDWHLVFSKYLIKYGMHANTIHDGCAVEEGPDHKLWVTIGDADQRMRAQNPKQLNGKVLRLNRDGSVPTDNPIMPGTSQRSIVYSMGHRNSQGIAFEPGTGRVYEVEHGPDVNDEINWIRPGLNYGWPCVTGFGEPTGTCDGGPFTNPAWASGGVTIANSNGTFLSGAIWLDLRDDFVTAQLKQSDLRRYTISTNGTTATYQATYFDEAWGRLRATVIGPNHYLWITTSNGTDDKVIRVIPAAL